MTTQLQHDQGAEARATGQRAACWTRHWQSGALHSCQSSAGDANYTGDIAAFWMSVFASLPAQARVLEPCCGNAPLAKLLIESPHQENVQRVSSVDIAEVSPGWIAHAAPSTQDRLDVRGGVDVAALPWPPAEFDLCMSQFGLEYAPPRALVEVSRVLRPGGRFAAVVHHCDSLTAQIAREEQGHATWLRDQMGLGELTERVVAFLAEAEASADPSAARASDAGRVVREHFNAALSRIAQRIEHARYPDLLLEQRELAMRAIQPALQGRIEQSRGLCASARQHLDDAWLRQSELVTAAMDRAAVLAWIAPLQSSDVALRPLEFRPGLLAGWGLVVQLP